jgi:hypothetical protein
MKRSATSELPRQNFGDETSKQASGNARMSDSAARTNPPVPVFRGAAIGPAPVSKDDSRCADASRRASRPDLLLQSRTMRMAAHVYPFFRNAGRPHVRSTWPTTLHPGREVPRDDAWH